MTQEIRSLFRKHLDPISRKLDQIIERRSCSQTRPTKINTQLKRRDDTQSFSSSTPNCSRRSYKEDPNFRNNAKSSTLREPRNFSCFNPENLARLQECVDNLVKETQLQRQLEKGSVCKKEEEMRVEKEIESIESENEHIEKQECGIDEIVKEKHESEGKESEELENLFSTNQSFLPTYPLDLQVIPKSIPWQIYGSHLPIEVPKVVAFGNSQNMPLDVSKAIPLEVSKGTSREEPKVVIIEAPSTLQHLKKIQQPMEFFIIKQPTPIKQPPWFAINIHLVNSFSFTNFNLFYSNLIHLSSVIQPIYDDNNICHFDFDWYIKSIHHDGVEQTLCPLNEIRKDTIFEVKRLDNSCGSSIGEKHEELILPTSRRSSMTNHFDLRTNRSKEREDDVIMPRTKCFQHMITSRTFYLVNSDGVLPYFIIYLLIYALDVMLV
ncbi:uncharacterized protein LOC120137285 [Hibiscus syriacus]|uniref:uncharacterized protein LOC120137285 n=1 Tax=Hibiscus syriacus TaxID=106335 RepID=UPI001924435C|nr:uncharacterized protein LOC120137285 [Hibiscus syriacus]XP_039009013.1 uncharacterized protein LOC120137285 [Hibiscus syriacus]